MLGFAETTLGFSDLKIHAPAPEATVMLSSSRIRPPASLSDVIDAGDAARMSHTYGRAYRDLVRGHAGDFAAAPDIVAHPRSEAVRAWSAGSSARCPLDSKG
jgi:alkyldihydroxyacetonephosphate synthase